MFITDDQLWRYMLPTEQWKDIVADSWFYQLGLLMNWSGEILNDPLQEAYRFADFLVSLSQSGFVEISEYAFQLGDSESKIEYHSAADWIHAAAVTRRDRFSSIVGDQKLLGIHAEIFLSLRVFDEHGAEVSRKGHFHIDLSIHWEARNAEIEIESTTWSLFRQNNRIETFMIFLNSGSLPGRSSPDDENLEELSSESTQRFDSTWADLGYRFSSKNIAGKDLEDSVLSLPNLDSNVPRSNEHLAKANRLTLVGLTEALQKFYGDRWRLSF